MGVRRLWPFETGSNPGPTTRASRRLVDFLLFKIMRNVRRDVSQRHSASPHPLDSPNRSEKAQQNMEIVYPRVSDNGGSSEAR